MRIAVFTALREERLAVRSAWQLESAGSLLGTEVEVGQEVVVACTGVGPHRMSDCVERVTRVFSPDLTLLVGYCAGLKPQLKVGDLVADSRGEPSLLERLAELYPRLRVGPIANSGFLTSAEDKSALAHDNPESPAADMETKAFFEASGSLPSLAIRAVSDTLDTNLPLNFGDYLDNWGFPDTWAIAKAVMARPRVVGQMVGLARDSSLATKALADLLVHLKPVLVRHIRRAAR